MADQRRGLGRNVGLGVAAGLGGTAVMTVFQKVIEMPISGREDSYAPAIFAEEVLGVHARSRRGRTVLNYAVHFALGTMWGAAYGVTAHLGVRGPRAVATVFGIVYSGDVLLNTALGLYRPLEWSRRDWIIDVTDKLVQAGATGAVFDRVSAS